MLGTESLSMKVFDLSLLFYFLSFFVCFNLNKPKSKSLIIKFVLKTLLN